MRICAPVLHLCLGGVFFAGGAFAAPPKPAKSVPPTVALPMPKLRTGERKLVDGAAKIVATIAAQSTNATEQILRLHLELGEQGFGIARAVARSVGGAPTFAISAGGSTDVWIRRSSKDATRAIEGEAYVPGVDAEPAHRFFFTATPPVKSVDDAKVRTQFAEDAIASFEAQRHSVFDAFAIGRLRQRYAIPGAKPEGNAPRRFRGDELERLMETTTGMASIQEAIQADRPLWLRTAKEKASVPLTSVKGPALKPHPFAAMLRTLKRSAREEKLAASTPADFYYVRLDGLDVFFRLVDQIEGWATPALNVLEGRGTDHALAERTLVQLGLERGPLARALGPQVVTELAVVGSDPYLREGNDVTVLFRVKQKQLFDVAVGSTVAKHLAAHGEQPIQKVVHEGVTIEVARSSDGAVRQHRAGVGDLEIVSTSLRATRHVIDAIAGRAPRLSDEPDLKYLLARDNGPCDGFVFLGDRFIAEVVGPRQKILESRRQLALADLLVPGYAALLFGQLEGRTPASTEELIGSGLLKREELRHAADGSAITFVPGRGARSAWGAPAALEPLYDLPTPTTVTASEKDAYASFAEGYQRYWSQYLDPIGIRLTVGAPVKGGEARLSADVRVLPLIDGTEYRRLEEMVGKARLITPRIADGFRAVLGIGDEASLRRDVTRLAGSSQFGRSFVFDWLGDWLFFGVDDKPEIAHALLAMEPRAIPQAPAEHERDRNGELAAILRTPAYLGIGVRNAIGAAIFLTAARKLALDAAPGIITWSEGEPYKSARIVRISVAARAMGGSSPGGSIYYAIDGGALLFSLSEPTLKHLIDEGMRKDRTDAVARDSGAPQFVLEWASKKDAPLNQVLGWLLEAQAVRAMESSRAHAESILRGAPGADLRTIALAYEGSAPVPVDGGSYTIGPEGVRDPSRGSALAERWPALPVPGSPVERLLQVVGHFRGEVAFDDEPRIEGGPVMRSLHVNVTLGVR